MTNAPSHSLKSLVKSAGGQITGEDDNEVQSVGPTLLQEMITLTRLFGWQ